MALDISTDTFHELAGHNGSQVIFPKLPEPQCRRGFHIVEAVIIAMSQGFSCTPVELMPLIASSPLPGYERGTFPVFLGPDATEETNWTIFTSLIRGSQGVIECRIANNGSYHAIAFEDGVIFDPEGQTFDYSREACEKRGLYTQRLWQIAKVG
jgi:hypothetical protein